MKAHLTEGASWFEISLEAETMEEATQLLRLSTKSRKEIGCITRYNSDKVHTELFFRKKKNPPSASIVLSNSAPL